ncbi:MAG: ferrous iron transport protein B [Clostridiaceae bacterium]|nr:ferrous iron transport protein B [Clostridiaceae bacterium]
MNITFALAGNQNCGKTTLFNLLTGSRQHVGNFPGVTVERKEGDILGHSGAHVVDLPGIYSLSPYTSEEVVTRDYLLSGEPQGIINIADATNIERNLYLTLQLIELDMPMVLALNMMDEMVGSGGSVDVDALSEELGIPVVAISAINGDGVHDLVDKAIEMVEKQSRPRKIDFCEGAVHRALHSVAHIIEDHAQRCKVPKRFAASKLVEGDKLMTDKLNIHEADLDVINHIVEDMEKTLGTDREAALADMRYTFIEEACKQTVKHPGETKEQKRSWKIDQILTHKLYGIPIFLGIMMLVFYITFGLVGPVLSGWFESIVDVFIGLIDKSLVAAGVSSWLHSLIIDGACAGIGAVLSFLPTIVVLFFLLSLLEDSGYMARVAFVMDKLLRSIGLSGRSFVPMLIGFGCSVPAIMATRTLPGERDRKMTILLIPFMSCSAKLPIYSIMCQAFFPKHTALVMMGLYVTGMLVGILVGFLLKSSLFRGRPAPFVLELPSYRVPSLRSSLYLMWEKAKDFLVKAFTIIFIASIVIWLLQNLDFGFNMVSDVSDSMLVAIGRFVAPIFTPLGFGKWQCVAALISGLGAKEAVVSTFTMVLGASEGNLAALLAALFTPLQAVSFLVFTLLYMPCVAAMAAVRRELGGMGKAVGVMAFQTSIAWIVSFVIYSFGLAVGL